LFEQFHQLVPAVPLDGGLFFRAQAFFELLDQPVDRDVFAGGQGGLDTAVVGAEGRVVAVVQRLVFYQRGAGQVIEAVERRRHDVVAQGVEQGQVFLDRDRQLVGAQVVEEIGQHGGRGVGGQRRALPRVMAARRSSSCTSCSFLSSAPAII